MDGCCCLAICRGSDGGEGADVEDDAGGIPDCGLEGASLELLEKSAANTATANSAPSARIKPLAPP